MGTRKFQTSTPCLYHVSQIYNVLRLAICCWWSFLMGLFIRQPNAVRFLDYTFPQNNQIKQIKHLPEGYSSGNKINKHVMAPYQPRSQIVNLSAHIWKINASIKSFHKPRRQKTAEGPHKDSRRRHRRPSVCWQWRFSACIKALHKQVANQPITGYCRMTYMSTEISTMPPALWSSRSC